MKKNTNDSASTISHKFVVASLVITVVMIGVVTTLSMRSGQAQRIKTDPRSSAVTDSKSKPYVTTDGRGNPIVLDRKTGQTRDLTPKEARMLADGLKQLINQSTDGLTQVQHEDGSVSMDLQGRFQNVMLAKKEDDGSISQSCVDNLESAANFFEIDPELVGLAKRSSGYRAASTKLEDR